MNAPMVPIRMSTAGYIAVVYGAKTCRRLPGKGLIRVIPQVNNYPFTLSALNQ